jgi:hypothetical protein
MARPKMTLAAIMIRTPGLDPAGADAVSHVSLEALFHGHSAEVWRAAYSGAFDWGPDLSREIVDE